MRCVALATSKGWVTTEGAHRGQLSYSQTVKATASKAVD